MVEISPTPPLETARQRLDWLQCGRAVAAISVCCFHASERVMKHAPDLSVFGLFHFGKLGVDLFFVISGFIICYIHDADIGRPRMLGRYAYRRATRIYPLYWLLLLAVLPLYLVFPDAGDGSARDLGSVIRCFFLLPNPPNGQIIGVAWTLVYEISFYAAFALLILNRWIGAALIAAWSLLILLNTLGVGVVQGYAAQFLGPRYFEFAVGAAVYYASQHWRPKGALLLSVIAMAVLFTGGNVSPAIAAVLSTVSTQVLLAGLICGVAVLGLVTEQKRSPTTSAWGRALTALGDASYSIYLFHWLIGWIIDKVYLKLHLPPNATLAYFPILVSLMIAGGYVVHVVLERRLMAFFGNLWRRHLSPARPEVLPAA
jgi:exopolysaccharide production protein ExoZ